MCKIKMRTLNREKLLHCSELFDTLFVILALQQKFIKHCSFIGVDDTTSTQHLATRLIASEMIERLNNYIELSRTTFYEKDKLFDTTLILEFFSETFETEREL